MSSEDFDIVASFKLEDISKDSPFSLEDATPKRFRLLHINPYLEEKPTLTVVTPKTEPTEHAVPENLKDRFAAISHVWQGLSPPPKNPTIPIFKLNEKDYASIEGLRIVCEVAKSFGYEYLWIDKFCIQQNDTVIDNPWQVSQMFNIYQNCGVCIVAPGGLARLPEINEKTTWVERAWTLQEGLAPKSVKVLFKWKNGPGQLQSNYPTKLEQAGAEVGSIDLLDMLRLNLKGDVTFKPDDSPAGGKDQLVRVRTFLNDTDVPYSVMALIGAMEQGETDGQRNAIWRCLLIRTARYKEDLVFSSMGVMGAVVDGKGIRDETKGPGYSEDEITKLLIRFVQKMVTTRNDDTAEWLGTAPGLGTDLNCSGLPALPLARNIGTGFKEDKESTYSPKPVIPNWEEGEGEDAWWWLSNSPSVSVAENGDIKFTRKAVPVEESNDPTEYKGNRMQSETPQMLVNLSTHLAWDIKKGLPDAKSFAINIGHKEFYRDGAFPTIRDTNSTLTMIVQETSSGRYRNLGYAWADENIGGDWEEREFVVGG